jgi:putative tricarboxylic transport membrane protein
MSPTSAIIMLSCIYWGALFGGAITSVLFNIPGEPWSVATTFDGHPMAQKGKAGEALTAAFTSSFVGALFAVIMITLVAPLVAKFALQFGPAEKFAVFFLAFCSFIGMGKEPPFKTIAAMMIGFRARRRRASTACTGQLRLTFGFTELLNGFDFLSPSSACSASARSCSPWRRALVQGTRRRHQSEGGVGDLEGAAALLGDRRCAPA